MLLYASLSYLIITELWKEQLSNEWINVYFDTKLSSNHQSLLHREVDWERQKPQQFKL